MFTVSGAVFSDFLSGQRLGKVFPNLQRRFF
jgi:hypothetical protein